MLKLLIYFHIFLLIINQNEGKSFKRGRLNVGDDNSIKDNETWQHMWFPHPPNNQNVKKTVNDDVAVASPTVNGGNSPNSRNSSDWPGIWFPIPPKYQNEVKANEESVAKLKESDQIRECDDGKYNLGVDFDPRDKRHSYNYLCFGKRSEYLPNLNTTAVITEYGIPAAYEPPVKCINETIEYSEELPTFGAYRPLAPKFGSYQYLPPQRWLHSLADGAIVLLYHPCAFPGQIEQLQNSLRGCLYRHVITTSQRLTPQRPLALLAWGKSLKMSVVDDDIVIKFIKDNAKRGFRKKQEKLKLSTKLYDDGLLSEAHLITDEQDKEICGYRE